MCVCTCVCVHVCVCVSSLLKVEVSRPEFYICNKTISSKLRVVVAVFQFVSLGHLDSFGIQNLLAVFRL